MNGREGGTTAGLLAGWRVYGITTLDRPERAAHLERQLARLGLPWEVLRSHRPPDPGGFASAGVRGCFESHRTSLEAAHDAGVEVALVVEDDVWFVSGFVRKLETIARELDDQDWSMVYPGYLKASDTIFDATIELTTEHVARAAGWEVRGSHCIAFSRHAIPAVLSNMDARLVPGGHRIPIDGVYNEYRRDAGEHTLICIPNLAHQAPSNSGITRGTSRRAWLLESAAVRRALEIVKGLVWNGAAMVPPRVVERAWNRRAANN
jgi:glycosyl transferase, family 25